MMVIEILVTLAIVSVSGYMVYKNIRNSASGKCNYEECSYKCSKCSRNV